MNAVLYELQVDYVSEHGHFMVLSSAEGLRQEDLSSFQLSMLSANRIPGLLPLQLESRDGSVLLYYTITGKRMLTHWLRSGRLTLREYYGLLLAIVEVLGDSMVYMLQPGRYMLQEDFIYCGSGLQDLQLTYVPVERLEGKGSVAGDLRELASRWIHRVTELQGGGYQELMRYLEQEETFSLAELKQLLLRQAGYLEGAQGPVGPAVTRGAFGEAVTGETRGTSSSGGRTQGSGTDNRTAYDYGTMRKDDQGSEAYSAPAAASSRTAASGAFQRTAEREHEPAPAPRPWGEEGTFNVPDWLGLQGEAAKPSAPGGAAALEADGKTRTKKPFYVAMMTVLAWGMVWKLYADSPGEPKLYLCTGATLLIAAAALLVIGRMRKAEESAHESLYTPAEESGGLRPSKEPNAFLEGLGLSAASANRSAGSPGTDGWGSRPGASGLTGNGAESFAWEPEEAAGSFTASGAAAPSAGGSPSAGARRLVDAYFGPEPSAGSPAQGSSFFGTTASSPAPVQGADDLAGRTTLLRPADATVFLGGIPSGREVEEAVPCLELDRAGERERIRLTKASFIIGRTGGEADWVHDEMGVSRLHAELVRGADGSVGIKDLGSRNGTTVNGEALVPYKLHELKEGDRIRIVTTEFTYVTA
ncbi:hypothetical protein J2T17_001539 [Paenibacillus mucilaginosus]|uniref:DUF6382 domain-containing protein n=1 Tax=Paenibacillus mucilaginosus TaxID=61624 RepID=UPI003D22F2E3